MFRERALLAVALVSMFLILIRENTYTLHICTYNELNLLPVTLTTSWLNRRRTVITMLNELTARDDVTITEKKTKEFQEKK